MSGDKLPWDYVHTCTGRFNGFWINGTSKDCGCMGGYNYVYITELQARALYKAAKILIKFDDDYWPNMKNGREIWREAIDLLRKGIVE